MFQVFIVGAGSQSESVLAAALSKKFGRAITEATIRAGSMRVGSFANRAAAESVAAELTALGALMKIVPPGAPGPSPATGNSSSGLTHTGPAAAPPSSAPAMTTHGLGSVKPPGPPPPRPGAAPATARGFQPGPGAPALTTNAKAATATIAGFAPPSIPTGTNPGAVAPPPARTSTRDVASPQVAAGLAATDFAPHTPASYPAKTAQPQAPVRKSAPEPVATPSWENLSSAQFNLATIDGELDDDLRNAIAAPVAPRYEPPPEQTPVGPTPELMSVSSEPAPTKAKAKAAEPVDLFLPPEAQEETFNLEVAEVASTKQLNAPKQAPVAANITAGQAAPLAAIAASGNAARAEMRSSVAAQSHAAIARKASAQDLLTDNRFRFAVACALALAIGFVPAHLFARAREQELFSEIDKAVAKRQSAISNEDDWNALDAYRATQLANKRSEHRTIAGTAGGMWLLAAALLALGFTKKVPGLKLD